MAVADGFCPGDVSHVYEPCGTTTACTTPQKVGPWHPENVHWAPSDVGVHKLLCSSVHADGNSNAIREMWQRVESHASCIKLHHSVPLKHPFCCPERPCSGARIRQRCARCHQRATSVAYPSMRRTLAHDIVRCTLAMRTRIGFRSLGKPKRAPRSAARCAKLSLIHI